MLLINIPPVELGPLMTPLAPVIFLLPYWTFIVAFILFTIYLWLSHWPGKYVKISPRRADKFSPEKVPKNLDTIVIGSGSGGSSCANILAQSGQRVLLLEQHEERTGGCTHTFRINNCEWDTGLHYTSEGMGLPTHRAGALLKFMTKGKQEWERLYVFFGLVFCQLVMTNTEDSFVQLLVMIHMIRSYSHLMQM